MRRLPPLTAIEAFVQVARLGSVKAAAEELALSSPALSRRVQALERFMGRSLFERRHQAMMLSSDGEMLLSRIAPALDALTLAIDATSGDTELVRLRLGVMPLFASQRLMGRLPELRQRHPELHIDIDTGSHALARLGEGVDAAMERCDLLADLFSVRARGLLAGLSASAASAFTSGLLIGADVRVGLGEGGPTDPVTIVGDPKLTSLYSAAVERQGRICTQVSGETAFLSGIRAIRERMR